MSNKILEVLKMDTVLQPATITNGTSTSSFVNLANYDRVEFFISQGANSSSPVLTVTAYQATNTAGGGAVAISGASTVATCTASTPISLELRSDAIDMVNYPTYTYVGFLAVGASTGTATNVSAVSVRTPARYKQTTMPS